MNLRYGTENDAGIFTGTAEKLEKRIQSWIDEKYTTMAEYIAIKDGVIFAHNALGKKQPDIDDTPMNSDAIFPVSSITKTFTATVIMMITEEGLLAPTDRVSTFIPEFKGEKKGGVTIFHLLTHTSGIDDDKIRSITDEELNAVDLPGGYLEKYPTASKYFYVACGMDMERYPEEHMSYSSFGFGVLGEIICRVTGKDLDTVFREKLFEPLGMKNTYLIVPDKVKELCVRFPSTALFKGITTEDWFKSVSAAGGAFSNAYDLAAFGQMFLNKGEYNGVRLLSRLTVNAMTMNRIPSIKSYYGDLTFIEAGWGLSFAISLDKNDESGTFRSRKTFGHSGAGCSMLTVDPENNVVTVLMVCTEESMPIRRFDRFNNMVMSGVI